MIKLDILSLIPVTYKQCSHCESFYDQAGIGDQVHDQILGEYPEKLLEDANHLRTYVIELKDRYKDEISIRVIDSQSLMGIFKSLRFWVRKYPAFIINNQSLILGWDREALENALEAHSSPNV